MTNLLLSQNIIHQLIQKYGVQTFCLCPGGRNAPLATILFHLKQKTEIEVLSFFDERSAGFFALGNIRKTKRPCVVVTTSGTAVAELLPAMIEAHYAHLPLVALTADRPSSYRHTGSPQSIIQPGVFSHYAEKSWDLEKEPCELEISQTLPCHINICFDEPLIDEKEAKDLKHRSSILHSIDPSKQKASYLNKKTDFTCIDLQYEKPLYILSELPQEERKPVEEALTHSPFPIYAEALSGLRESRHLQKAIIQSGEPFLDWLVLNKKIESVIRIGRTPCTRFWRNLENKYKDLPVLSVSDQSWTALSRPSSLVSFSTFLKWINRQDRNLDLDPAIKTEDQKRTIILNELLEKHPLSEPALIRKISKSISSNSFLFLGNSLPIRKWCLAGLYQPHKQISYMANRGANGIDGLLSTFFGACNKQKTNWCLIGDLSCLYDLSAPWIWKQLDPDLKCFIVIINNRGGQIFSSLFSNPLFLNSHNLSFEKWTKMWSFNYYLISDWPDTLSFSSPAVIELAVDPTNSHLFNKEYQSRLT